MVKMHKMFHVRVEVETGVVMKPVVQLEQTGCGIASVAALAGVSYRSVQRKANRLRHFRRRFEVVVRDTSCSKTAQAV